MNGAEAGFVNYTHTVARDIWASMYEHMNT